MKNIYVPAYIHFFKSWSPFCLSLYFPVLWLWMIKKKKNRKDGYEKLSLYSECEICV